MRSIFKLDTPITSGVVLIGEFSNVGEILLDLEQKIKSELNTNYKKLPSSAKLLYELYDNDSTTRQNTFELAESYETRKHTLLFVDQVLLMEAPGETLGLIAEKRPLKLVMNIHLHDLFSLTDIVLDAIFGNYAHFVIGDLTYEDERILEDRLKI